MRKGNNSPSKFKRGLQSFRTAINKLPIVKIEALYIVLIMAILLGNSAFAQTALADKVTKVFDLIFEAGLAIVSIMLVLAGVELARGGGAARELFIYSGIAAGVIFAADKIAQYIQK